MQVLRRVKGAAAVVTERRAGPGLAPDRTLLAVGVEERLEP